MKSLVRDALDGLGIEIHRKRPSGWDPGNLGRFGLRPRTLVDVGVGYGTMSLYEAFPQSRLLLVEPLREFEGKLQEILRNREGRYELSAVGVRKENLQINIQPGNLQTSTLNRRSELTAGEGDVERRTVPVTTLDALRLEHSLEPPFGLKIDTEGHEDSVILGATEFLRDTLFVISEVSVAQRFEGGYAFEDFIALMRERGFRLKDILEVGRLRNNGASYIDAVFVRGPGSGGRG